MAKQTTISLRPEEYKKLREVKDEVERRVGSNFDWGAFLCGLVAGGVLTAIVQDVIKEKKKKEGEKKRR